MAGDDYLDGLPPEQAAELTRVNKPGLTALAWRELDALRAHVLLDQAEGIDRGWAAQADALHARLVPPGLDPDPLATVERLVAEQKAAEDEENAD